MIDNNDKKEVVLRHANLSGANLRNANLSFTDLRGVNLIHTDLSGADLRSTNLSGADLTDANLSGADLRCVHLNDTDLRDANLSYTDLSGANLRGANLRGTNLRNANLSHADLSDVKNMPFIPYACPDTGSFIGYKKASNFIITLEILEDAKRLSSTGRKCRCNKAKVLKIEDSDCQEAIINEVRSDYDKNFIYKVGEIVFVDDFDECRWNECSTGIHFFINKQEAIDYMV